MATKMCGHGLFTLFSGTFRTQNNSMKKNLMDSTQVHVTNND